MDFRFTKLNKLCKIDTDLIHKMDSLRREKNEVLGVLREKHAKTLQLTKVRTPKSQDKRTIVHSPTPRKSKRTLFSTPQKNDLAERHDIISLQKADQMEIPCVETLKSAPENHKAMSITIKSFTPSKLKVFWHFIILLLLFSQYQNTQFYDMMSWKYVNNLNKWI